jgi:hypothetical protein
MGGCRNGFERDFRAGGRVRFFTALVIPAQAGTQCVWRGASQFWAPACAGVTT